MSQLRYVSIGLILLLTTGFLVSCTNPAGDSGPSVNNPPNKVVGPSGNQPVIASPWQVTVTPDTPPDPDGDPVTLHVDVVGTPPTTPVFGISGTTITFTPDAGLNGSLVTFDVYLEDNEGEFSPTPHFQLTVFFNNM